MRQLSSRDWFGKASAGLVLGLLFALGVSGLIKQALGAPDRVLSLEGQISMWMMAPIWCLILSLCFLFASPGRAWGWLALANGLLWGALWLMGGLAL